MEMLDQVNSIPKDTLIMIGNGFDIWQGLHTSYAQFEEYYITHLDEILRELHLKKRLLVGKSGEPVLDDSRNPILYSDVELFYGDPYKPGRLPHSFWNTFESSLDQLDDQQLNLYFGKDPSGLKGIQRGVQNARRILEKAFCDWIATIKIDEQESGYRFGNHCLFVNFNYTDTLIKRFGVEKENEYHIHGETYDKKSIIFGHATHPEQPFRKLFHMGERYRGLFYVEDALYQTDKHVEDNYTSLRMFFALHGLHPQAIKQVYVVGHSFGPADLDYFKHLINATQGTEEAPRIELSLKEQDYLDQLNADGEMFLNIQYASHHRERMLGKKPVSYPDLEKIDKLMYEILEDPYYRMTPEEQFRLEAAAVHRRFLSEQEIRNKQAEREFMKMLRRVQLGSFRAYSGTHMVEPININKTGTDTRSSSTEWRISYFSADDKARIEAAMEKFGCRNYTLYPTIDECLAPFKQ